MPYFVVVLGTAGSGKTSLSTMLNTYLASHELDSIVVNLDPAVEDVPYIPDVDVRDYVNVYEIMKRTGLGPNGALIAAVDLVLANINDIYDEVHSMKANYVIIDTPGQMELFAFRDTGPLVLKSLIGDFKAAVLFVIDATYALAPSNFLSSLLLLASTHVRLGYPQVNVITKTDIIPKEDLEKIISYLEDPSYFASEVVNDGRARLIWSSEEVESLVEKLLAFDFVPVSNKTGEGFDNLYAAIQRIVAGGEDYFTEEPNPVY